MLKDDIESRAMDLSVETAAPPPCDQPYHDDDSVLRRLGKRPRLTRTFGFMLVLGFSCSSLCSWESILLTSVPGLVIGGPAGLTWTLVLNSVGITSIHAVLGELASIAPTSGGQYHWVAMLAPQRWSNFLSYLTAWLTTLAWQAISATVSYHRDPSSGHHRLGPIFHTRTSKFAYRAADMGFQCVCGTIELDQQPCVG
ncbi:hypothetical protein F4801DRAFT_595379 [Xylaria longipes]|nr:hypothetical protein F4801DRAFT_595379 [Xylaria longipes]